MKTQLNFLLVMALLVFASACQNKSGEDSTSGEALEIDETANATSASYSVDTQVSTVDWTGSKIVGDDKHMGKINISEGEFLVNGGALTGGSFTLDMNSLEVTDLEAGNGKAKLEGHLKNTDFFEVETYPTAKFEIAGVSPVDTIEGANHIISGNLTMKEATKSISFRVEILESSIIATTLPFEINRTEWGVNYGSTLIGALKDKAISDAVSLSIKVRGKMTEEVQ